MYVVVFALTYIFQNIWLDICRKLQSIYSIERCTSKVCWDVQCTPQRSWSNKKDRCDTCIRQNMIFNNVHNYNFSRFKMVITNINIYGTDFLHHLFSIFPHLLLQMSIYLHVQYLRIKTESLKHNKSLFLVL